jgi:hypothetical protein
MFIIFGDKHRIEPVANGLRVHRKCPKCGQDTLFIERVVSQQFRLYFVEMFTHGTHHVLECTECRTAFVTDEVKGKQVANDHSSTVYGKLQDAVSRGKQALDDSRVIERAEAQVGETVGAAQKALGGLLGRLGGRDEPGKR